MLLVFAVCGGDNLNAGWQQFTVEQQQLVVYIDNKQLMGIDRTELEENLQIEIGVSFYDMTNIYTIQKTLIIYVHTIPWCFVIGKKTAMIFPIKLVEKPYHDINLLHLQNDIRKCAGAPYEQ